ncbi:protein B2 [Pariacoto virus]|uniref:Protein B2 n=1 Tax=Pariacoto virus TaxID=103782 RepID=Q9J7Z1_PAV|nr:protein B2 [Pariacoto virus]AAF71692.1 protein B2 [Pariacoto virus]
MSNRAELLKSYQKWQDTASDAINRLILDQVEKRKAYRRKLENLGCQLDPLQTERLRQAVATVVDLLTADDPSVIEHPEEEEGLTLAQPHL